MSVALKPWYAVSTPHKDIREKRLDEAVFAANVWAVAQDNGPEVYLDAEEFFRKTYMTVGIAAILKRVALALSGGGETGDRIISLQTSFGGGKTHTLVALWHLARHAHKLHASDAAAGLRAALTGVGFPREVKGVAVFTNATCDPTQGRRTPDGVHTHTLWGEIAYQLGGSTLYEKVRPNDETQRVPQGLFVDVLKAASPCLILLDELADYCVGAAAVPVGDTTLADQTISFMQQLTEAVQQVPGCVVVATLPASKEEVASSEKGQEAFITLEKRFQRLGADLKPVADDEIYAVVRTRLFEQITPEGEEDYPARVASAYHAMYAAHANEVPTEASKTTIKEQIEKAYPFHPSLIDGLYQRWGGHPDFQRTRGVLRLMASVIGDLWERRDATTQSQPLIQPCHVRWTIDAMNAALTRLWGAPFQAVVAADVVGVKSNAGGLDAERGGDYERERIAEGIAAATLLGSFGSQADRSGYSGKDLKYVCSRPGLNWSYTEGAFVELENRCFFLHSASAGSLGKRYWFGTKPTLNKLVVQYRQQFSGQSFDQEIIDALKAAGLDSLKASVGARGDGPTWRVLVDPGVDLPEQKALTLILLRPSLAVTGDESSGDAAEQAVLQISQQCGGKDRMYRNTLLFLAPTSRGLSRLRQAHRDYATLMAVQRDYGDRLDPDQKEDLRKRLDAASKAAAEALGPAYITALRVRGDNVLETVALGDARSNFSDHLSYLWQTLIADEEWILRTVGEVTLKEAGLISNSSPLRVKDAVEAFLKFTDKPMVVTREAVTTGLARACERAVIGIGRGASPSTFLSRTCGSAVSLDPTEEGLWIIPPFKEEEPPPPLTIQLPGGEQIKSQDTGGGISLEHGLGSNGEEPSAGSGSASPSHNIRRFRIQGTVPLESWSDVFRCFVAPTAKMGLKRQSLGINFDLEASEGASIDPSDQAFKTMREAARQLGLNIIEE